jgi:caffeoyl-CoA O-methyltransferase
MSNRSITLTDPIYQYMNEVSLREAPVLRALHEETAALAQRSMQIAPEQGQFMALLVRLCGARLCLEVGVFTGYSSLATALALPADGRVADPAVTDADTVALRRFNAALHQDPRIDLSLLPVGDGLTLALKR